ncbi:MAG: hypothetical protein EPN36_13880 [Rhodanobacteraceae bacterium]|nr:MAG: hypothetical protein EPN36_13880 [Rhodanobacteraceae bacterium]
MIEKTTLPASPDQETHRFIVRWEVEMDAVSSQAAAADALVQMRDPASTATAFDVGDTRTGMRDRVVVVQDGVFPKAPDGSLTPVEVFELLRQKGGVTLSDFVAALARKRDEYDLAAVKAAAEECVNMEGDLEIDDNALTSRSEDAEGCYVMAWKWVGGDEMDLDGKAGNQEHD